MSFVRKDCKEAGCDGACLQSQHSRQKQEDHKFKANLGCLAKLNSCLKKQNKIYELGI
jgi:hypothetical protein